MLQARALLNWHIFIANRSIDLVNSQVNFSRSVITKRFFYCTLLTWTVIFISLFQTSFAKIVCVIHFLLRIYISTECKNFFLIFFTVALTVWYFLRYCVWNVSLRYFDFETMVYRISIQSKFSCCASFLFV